MRLIFSAPTFAKDPGQSGSVLLAEAEIYIDGGHAGIPYIGGMRIAGLRVWQGERGLYVTMPSRPVGMGESRKYIQHLAPIDRGRAGELQARRISEWVINEFQNWRAS